MKSLVLQTGGIRLTSCDVFLAIFVTFQGRFSDFFEEDAVLLYIPCCAAPGGAVLDCVCMCILRIYYACTAV